MKRLNSNYKYGRLADMFHGFFVRSEIRRLTREGLPLFSRVNIETQNWCNGTCEFCPVNRRDNPRKKAIMPDAMFKDILRQLADLDYAGRLGLNANNEPLLDERITEFAALARKAVPRAMLYLFTNGTLLTDSKLNELMKSLDTLCITNYGGTKARKRLSKIGVEKFEGRVVIDDFGSRDIRTSRAGQAKNKSVVKGLKSPCIYPFVQFVICADGKVIQCCADAINLSNMGNIGEQPLTGIWFGSEFEKTRSALLESRQGNKLCANCDMFAFMPERLVCISRKLFKK